MPKLPIAKIGEDDEQVIGEIDIEAKPESVKRYTGMEDLEAAHEAGENVEDHRIIREVEIERRAAETMEQRAVIPPLVAARWRAVTARLSADAARGHKLVEDAREGHAQMYGSEAEKRERWQRIYNDWQAEKAKGTPKPAVVAAAKHGVCVRTVHRTAKYLSKID